MDNLEIAKALFGNSGNASNSRSGGQTTTGYGIATSGSANGIVRVNLGGETVSPDDDQTIEIETTFKVKDGDEVIVSMVGADGTGKIPVVTGVVGRGDEQQEEIDSVVNYFWSDERGAHVSTVEHSVEGANILLDSDSLDIRNGASDSEDDQTVLASFGREITVGSRDMSEAVGQYSQVYGQRCVASGRYSKASGFNTISGSDYQTVIGRNNIADEADQYALIVGNGNYPNIKESFTTDGSATSFPLSYAPESVLDISFGDVNHANPLDINFELISITKRRFYLTEGVADHDIPIKAYFRDVSKNNTEYAAVIPAGSQYSDFVEPYSWWRDSSADMSSKSFIYAPLVEPVQYSLSGNTITLNSDSAYWATQLSGLSLNVFYEYAGVTTRSNAMTVDWNGNLHVAGKISDGRGEIPRLLWENPHPLENFTAQTVSLDLSGWSLVAISIIPNTNNDGDVTLLAKVGRSSILSAVNYGSNQYYYMRKATVSSSGVQFSTGYRNTTGTSGAGYAIPQAIYGVC